METSKETDSPSTVLIDITPTNKEVRLFCRSFMETSRVKPASQSTFSAIQRVKPINVPNLSQRTWWEQFLVVFAFLPGFIWRNENPIEAIRNPQLLESYQAFDVPNGRCQQQQVSTQTAAGRTEEFSVHLINSCPKKVYCTLFWAVGSNALLDFLQSLHTTTT